MAEIDRGRMEAAVAAARGRSAGIGMWYLQRYEYSKFRVGIRALGAVRISVLTQFDVPYVHSVCLKTCSVFIPVKYRIISVPSNVLACSSGHSRLLCCPRSGFHSRGYPMPCLATP
jgi:hypothetical protein